MAIKPKRTARRPYTKRDTTILKTSHNSLAAVNAFFKKLGLIVLSGFFLTFVVLALMLIIGFFASSSKDICIIFANAILKFQSIRAGIFTSGILLLGIVLIGAILHKARWLWSGVLVVTLIFVTLISVYVDFILYGQTSSAYVPSEIVDALYQESTPYRTRRLKPTTQNHTHIYQNERAVTITPAVK